MKLQKDQQGRPFLRIFKFIHIDLWKVYNLYYLTDNQHPTSEATLQRVDQVTVWILLRWYMIGRWCLMLNADYGNK